MMLKRRGRALALTVVTGWLVAGALASDDDSEPLYVIHNGQRIPTVVIPPRPSGDRATRPAVLEVVELDPGLARSPEEAGQRRGFVEPGDDERGPRRGYAIGRYAGYPISIPRWPQPGWYYGTYPPPSYYGQALKETYRAERWIRDRERGRVSNVRDMKRRKARVLASHEKALRVGLEDLKRGDYAQAVIALEMAAALNHGDPACRIHLAQARMAQGHYKEAGRALRRALQLQPKLVYVTLNLSSYYPDDAESDRHVDELAGWLSRHRAGASTWFLLGYMEFQRGNLDEAYAAFRGVARAMPEDSLTGSYLKITKPPSK